MSDEQATTDYVPERAMVVVAHPDDAEFGCAGTIARWTEAGAAVCYVLCTSGDVGIDKPGVTRAQAAEIREAEQRGEDLGLSHQEHAFFNALETDVASVRELGEDVLCQIAKALTQVIRDNITIDWAVSERKQAELRLLLRDILDEFGYPSSEQESAVRTVLEQAKLNAQNQEEE